MNQLRLRGTLSKPSQSYRLGPVVGNQVDWAEDSHSTRIVKDRSLRAKWEVLLGMFVPYCGPQVGRSSVSRANLRTLPLSGTDWEAVLRYLSLSPSLNYFVSLFFCLSLTQSLNLLTLSNFLCSLLGTNEWKKKNPTTDPKCLLSPSARRLTFL